MLSFALNTQPYLGGIYLYYTQDDTAKRQFHFEIDEFSARLASYQHDYDNTQLSDFIGDFALGDSLVFAQGMVGLNVEIELQNLEEFENIIVNKAELLVNLHPLSNVDTLYPPARQFLLSARNDDGAQLVISDVDLAAQSPSGLAGAFGGVLNKEDGTFTMNISAHFQQIIEGNAGKTLTLTVFPKADSPDRIILYGAGNPEKKILIRLAFTKL